MLSKRYSKLDLSPAVAAGLAIISKEENLSNLNQARLGERVAFNPKAIGISVEVQDYTDLLEKNAKTISEEVFVFSDPVFSGREPLIYKVGKHEKDLT